MLRRLALLGGSLTALVAAAVATLRGRKRGKGGKAARRGGRRNAGAAGRGARRAASPVIATTPAATTPNTAADTQAQVADAAEGAGPGDGLRAIKGIGAVMAERLAAGGVTSVTQVAAWSADDVAAVAARLGIKAERITREDWVGQAKALDGQPPKKGG